MNAGTKYELMQKMLEELADLKNNQAIIVEKISQLEKENVYLADTQLEMKLDDLYEIGSISVEKAKITFSFFQQKLADFAIENHLNIENA